MKKKAKAKINLTLDIVCKRPDGYHEVNMIMQTLELCDYINVEKIFSGIEISGTGFIPYDETNLAYKAAKLFFDVSGVRGGARIYIEKILPVCAGMGGGSSDGATVLCALNDLYGKPLSKKVLVKIASRLGADVPYFVFGGTALATGIGEKLESITPFEKTPVVVVKPPVSVSTPLAYKGLDFGTMIHPDVDSAVTAIENGDRQKLCKVIGNAFEQTVFCEYPQIEKVKSAMIALGADGALMSGSGSAVFGLFLNPETAKKAYNELKKEYKDVFLTYTTNE